MKIIENSPERLQVIEGYSWLKLMLGAGFLTVPVFTLFVSLDSPALEQRTFEGHRQGANVSLTFRITAPLHAPQTWQIDADKVSGIAITSVQVRGRRGPASTIYRLNLAMKVGQPWALFGESNPAALEGARGRIEHFLRDPAVRQITELEPQAQGVASGLFLFLFTFFTAGPFGAWFIWSGLATLTLLADRSARTLTVVSGSPGARRSHVSPFADILAVAPFDPQDRAFTEQFALAIDLRDGGRVRLGEFTGPAKGTAADAGTAGHDQLAAQLRTAIGLEAIR